MKEKIKCCVCGKMVEAFYEDGKAIAAGYHRVRRYYSPSIKNAWSMTTCPGSFKPAAQ